MSSGSCLFRNDRLWPYGPPASPFRGWRNISGELWGWQWLIPSILRRSRLRPCIALRVLPILRRCARRYERFCREQGICGTVLLAPEGINGTIAGSFEQVAVVLEHIRGLPGCADLEVKLSSADTKPFHRMKVRIKREIVTMGEPDVDPAANAGTYVEPEDWNALISDEDVIVIDTRNAYEVAIGSFAGAINPETSSFRDFPRLVSQRAR